MENKSIKTVIPQISNIILLLLALLTIVGLLFEIGTVLLVLTLALLCCLIIINLRHIGPICSFVLIANALMCVCTMLLYKGAGVVIIFMNLLAACIVFNKISFGTKTVRRVYFICWAGLLLYCATASSISREYDWLSFYDRNGKLVNNNSLGILAVSLCFSFLLWNNMRKGARYKKIFSILGYFVGFLMCFFTGCRSSMLVLIIYILLSFVFRRGLPIKTLRRIIIIIFCTSLLFTILYVSLYKVVPNATILGKSLFSGRETLWADTFEQIMISPLFGTGTTLILSSDFESVHNMLLGLWKNVGLLPMISVIFSFLMVSRVSLTHKQKIMLISVLFFAFFESFMMDFRFLFLYAFLLLGTDVANESANETNKVQGVVINDT